MIIVIITLSLKDHDDKGTQFFAYFRSAEVRKSAGRNGAKMYGNWREMDRIMCVYGAYWLVFV